MKSILQIAVEICVLLFPIFSAYALRLQAVGERLAAWLAEKNPEVPAAHFQKTIAPPGLWGSALLAVLTGTLLLGGGLYVFPWYVGIGLFAGSFFLILVMNYFIPSEKTAHYISVILKNLRKKLAGSGDDPENAAALKDLIGQLEVLKGTAGLFDEKPSY